MTLFQQATAAWNAFNPADISKPTPEDNAKRAIAEALDQQLRQRINESLARWNDGLINTCELIGDIVEEISD